MSYRLKHSTPTDDPARRLVSAIVLQAVKDIQPSARVSAAIRQDALNFLVAGDGNHMLSNVLNRSIDRNTIERIATNAPVFKSPDGKGQNCKSTTITG